MQVNGTCRLTAWQLVNCGSMLGVPSFRPPNVGLCVPYRSRSNPIIRLFRSCQPESRNQGRKPKPSSVRHSQFAHKPPYALFVVPMVPLTLLMVRRYGNWLSGSNERLSKVRGGWGNTTTDDNRLDVLVTNF